MSKSLLASKFVVFEEEPKVRTVAGAATSVAGAVGLAAKGPFDQPVLCNSFDDFQTTFGGFVAGSDLGVAVQGFFENGGSQLWVTRVVSSAAGPASAELVAPSSGATPAAITTSLAPPFNIPNNSNLFVYPDGNFYTIPFAGLPADLFGTLSAPFFLVDGMTLTLTVDNGSEQTVTFAAGQFDDIGHATVNEVAEAINAVVTGAVAAAFGDSVRITTVSRGNASAITVTGGSAVDLSSEPALITGTVNGPYTLEDGQDLTVTVNGTPYSIDFEGTAADIFDNREAPRTEPFELADGMTLILRNEDGVDQTATFSTDQFEDIGAATAQEVADAINAQITGVFASPYNSGIRIQSLIAGTTSLLTVVGGSSLTGPGSRASIVSTAPAPFALNDGDVFHIFSNDPYFFVVNGGSAEINPTSFEPYALADGMTLDIAVNGGSPQTITFSTGQFGDITAATALEVASAINATLVDAHATAPGTAFVLNTLVKGTSASLDITGGSAATPLGVSGQSDSGSGNVGNLDAVTPAELAALGSTSGAEAYLEFVDLGTALRIQTIDVGLGASVQADGIIPNAIGMNTDFHTGRDGNVLGILGLGFLGSGNVGNLSAVDGNEVIALLNGVDAGSQLDMSSSTVLSFQTLGTGSSMTIQVEGSAAGGLGLVTHDSVGVDGDRLGLFEGPQVGSGNVANLNAVTVAEVAGLVAGVSGDADFEVEDLGTAMRFNTVATGPSAIIYVSGGAQAGFGFDSDQHLGSDGSTGPQLPVVHVEARSPGAQGNLLSVQVNAPSDDEAGHFDLAILQDGVEVETFANLSRDGEDPRFIETIVNDPATGSQLLNAFDLGTLSTVPPTLDQSVDLTGGDDGFGGVQDSDFIGNEDDGTGFHALDKVQDLSILLVPGRATPAVHNAMLTYCEQFRDGNVFAVLDPPVGKRASEMVTYVTDTASLENASEFGAIYWPRVKVLNPNKSVFGSGAQITVPPSGIVAGVYARTDGARPGGVYDPPAGIESGQMFGVLGFEGIDTLKERKRDLVYPHRINPLTTGPGLPMFVDGSRTLKSTGNFPSVAERRGVIFIEQSLRKALSFARHKKNTPDLRAEVRRTLTTFLITQMNNGAFRSGDPAKAFFVDVSDQLNPPSVALAGKLNARIGLATNKPAEFVLIQISQDTRALDAEIAG